MTQHLTAGRRARYLAVAGLAAFSMVAASCSDDEAADDTTTTVAESMDDGSSATTTEPAGDMSDDMSDESSTEAAAPSGPACAAVPESGDGSFTGMADDPAATAASANPLLSTLVTAVGEAGLVDTLNGPGPYTIFAPTNDAFAKIPEADLNAVLADKDQLTKILTLHVVAGERLSAADLSEMSSVTTVEGSDISLEMDGDTLKVNGQATVGCADVSTANATVHIIDTVLMPA